MVYKIKALRGTNARAGKLVNTGAMPQATYGKEAGGLTPSVIKHLGTYAAQAVSTSTRGQCPTTLIWMSIGIHYDPMIKAIIDQAKTWLWLWYTVLNEQDDRIRKDFWAKVHHAWNKAKEQIILPGVDGAQPEVKYNMVHGPMGSIIAMLGTI